MVKYFKNPFASSGDKTAIPEASPPDGSISYGSGWGPNYQLDPGADSDALDIPRTPFNQLLFDITSAIQQNQQNGFPEFITTSDNGGTPYAYAKNSTVRYSGVNYYSLIDGNTDTPPSANWGLVVYSQGAPSGTTEFWMFSTIKPGGYIWINGTTIGNAASGATQRANADTATVFAMIWNDFSNTICPILNSAGAPVTRGVSAAADYALNRQLTLPDPCGRGLFFLDNMGGIAPKNRITAFGSGISGTTVGAAGGQEAVALTGNQNGQHNHAGSTDSAGNHAHTQLTLPASEDDNPDPPLNQSVIGNNIAGAPATYSVNAGTNSAGEHAHNITTSNSGLGQPHQNMPPAFIGGGLIMKL